MHQTKRKKKHPQDSGRPREDDESNELTTVDDYGTECDYEAERGLSMNSHPLDPGSRREDGGSTGLTHGDDQEKENNIEQGGNDGSFTCCGKIFKSQRGLRIHQGKTCMKVVQKCRTLVRKTRASVAQESNHRGDINTTVLQSEEIRL